MSYHVPVSALKFSVDLSKPSQPGRFEKDHSKQDLFPEIKGVSFFYFQTLFKEPSLILSVLLIVQSGLVMAQHISLTWSSHWYQLLSEALMLFSNYYALFKVLRDYIVFWRFFCNEPDPEQDK